MIKKSISLFSFVFFFFSVFAHANEFGHSACKGLQGGWPAGSMIGYSIGFIDANGDGIDDKIVGAPYAVSGSNTGALLVFEGDRRGGFSSCPMVLQGDDNYGFSFVNLGDVDGDGRDDFAVGAIHGDGADVSLSGSVIVFKGGRPWTFDRGLGKIIANLSGEGPLDKFGLSIAAGDLNGDGVSDLIVGAPFNTNDPAFYQAGAVYVYFGPDFARKVSLHASSLNKGLGWSAATGDINGDNVPDLCISATGKVLCYYGGQDFNPSIDAPDVVIKSAAAGFGKALAVIGDLNGNGLGEIMIGAPNAVVDGKRDTGSIYIVNGGTGNRTINADTTSSDLIVRIDGEALFDRFGSSIAPAGDVDRRQKADFIVGAPMAAVESFNLAGKVYFFKGEDMSSAATVANAVIFEGFAADQGFGTSLAASKNGWLLIGAPRMNENSGNVFMVDLD